MFNQDGGPLRRGRMVRGFEVDERSTAPEPLRPFTDLPQDGSYESQRARVRRQTALLEEYERHQGTRGSSMGTTVNTNIFHSGCTSPASGHLTKRGSDRRHTGGSDYTSLGQGVAATNAAGEYWQRGRCQPAASKSTATRT